ncbi:NAD(P)-dependent oxidoreductase [Mycolicibacterium arabiense]|uniref:NAD(P)-dependent oxidoreductase n=1 Tax=Mycolicibacterium arabiense TaxID=1286181 RepID=A0A7I7RYJ2_9MYCO|nr:NAD(P)H-binding protein [Mycolicibacterium arabiense]MCV7373821.1 NAD(P)H-binding protein [Mycolicibacterium arabiense]BBY49066.1 NAD(P)-dependent oxidoreductase [Mycolicibacterium arabiense]
MSIGITGASGRLGGAVAARLLDVVDAADVVLMSRTVESLSGFAARGVGVRPVDFGDPPSLAPAFEGVDSLLLISTDRVGDRVAGHVAAIEAAKEAGVRHVVYTSVPNPVAANPALAAPDHLATEDALRSSGLAWTSLRNNLYADMQVPSLRRAVEAGRLVVNSGDGRAAYVSRADCAAAAVGALTGRGETNTAYDITGPRALSAYDLAELTGAALEVVQLDDDAYVEALVGSGLAKDAANFIASFGRAVREGYLADVTTAVRDLTGRRPTSLDELVRPVEA